MKHIFSTHKTLRAFGAIALLCIANYGFAQTITTFAGGIGDNLNAVTYGRLTNPTQVAVDASGNVFIADNGNARIRKVTPSGTITTYQSITAYGITMDGIGNIYLTSGNVVYKLDTAHVLTPLAGTTVGGGGFSGDGSLATAARLSEPTGIAIDRIGNIYVADNGNNRIRKISTSGIITTIAGGGSAYGDGGLAISANISNPFGVAVDTAGNVYVADYGYSTIRKVNTSGIISTVAGTPGSCCSSSGDGGPATSATFFEPHDIKVDLAGNLYIADINNNNIRKVNTSGIITTIAGSGSGGFSGDGGAATAAELSNPLGITIDNSGNLYIADHNNNRIRKVNTSGIISTIAGNDISVATGFEGDGGDARLGQFSLSNIGVDHSGNVYVADIGNNRIRKINPSGIVSTIAGNGIVGFSGDGAEATAAELDQPKAVALDASGNLYIADFGTNHIRKVSASTGIITTLAGGGTGGLGDGGPATNARFTTYGVAVDNSGNVYIADAGNYRVRKVNVSTGIITTVAGCGTSGYFGDGGQATAASLGNPFSIALDHKGNLYIADDRFSAYTDGGNIRKVDTSGIITTIGSGLIGYIAADSMGNIYIASTNSSGPEHVVQRLDIYGYTATIAGNGIEGYVGDDGPAVSAELMAPMGVAIDGGGHVYIADYSTNASGNGTTIREVCCMSNIIDHPPVFAGGATQSLTVCENSTANAINSLMEISDADVGDHEKWTVISTPANGSLGGFTDSAISTGGTIIPSGLTYTPTIGYSGTDNFTIQISDGQEANTTVVRITVTTSSPDGITGASNLCVGSTTTLSDGTSGGTWSSTSSNATVGTTGIVTGITAGIDTIKYSITGICGSASASRVLTINPAPSAIVGPTVMCTGSTITLNDASSGGTWSSGNPGLASVGSTGIVTGVAAGSPVISYSFSSGCAALATVTVNPLPAPGTISGAAGICAGATTTLTDAATGGTWSSSNSHATVSSSRVVTAVSAGTDTIAYTVTNGCGTASATHIITINPLPSAGTITGASSVCTSAAITLADASAGGFWSSTDPYVSVGAGTGVVGAISAGAATITYTVSNSCGTATATTAITVNPVPSAGSITGSTTVCTGGVTTLGDAVTGGVWSSGAPAVVSVGGSGVVTGMAVGSAFVSYTVSNSCGAASAVDIVTVSAATPIDYITGASSVCGGSAATLADGTAGGSWSSSNPSVATVGSTGVVTGIAAGTAAISYSASLGCGLSVATAIFTVDAAPSAGSLSGSAALCIGATAYFPASESGGAWTVSNSNASISPAGIVTGVSSGNDTVIYTVTNSCGTATTSHAVTVSPSPAAGTVTGSSALCSGSTATLSDAATGGTWGSSDAAVATVGSTGVVTGVSGGTAIISYTVATGCGAATATQDITVDASAGIITGATTLCAGGAATLSSSIGGGTWSSSTPAVATVGSTGIVTGVTSGTAVITYSATGVCGPAIATTIVSVGTIPSVASITGASAVCSGSATALSDATSAGTWSSSNTAVATISSAGVVSGITTGTSTISYTLTAGCGSAGVAFAIAVQSTPSAGTISGTSSLCAGTTLSLTESASGGVWSSSNVAIATVGTSGIVTGVAGGSVAISYSVSNSCGTVNAAKSVTVNPAPNAGSISGAAGVCLGATTTLTETSSGGAWSSSATGTATVGSATGITTGIATGSANITYTVTNGCGTATTIHSITVNPLPYAGTISGTSSVCAGAATTLTDAAAGSSWVSSNTLIATVSSGGIVDGVAAGSATIYYTVTNGCGTTEATSSMSVNVPAAGTITGITTLCEGATATLTDAVSGGTWSSSATTVATIGSTGIIAGIAPGTAIITYAVTGTCGSASTTAVVTIDALPTVAAITGAASVCRGSATTFGDGTSGGGWSSSNTAIATAGSTGIITGVSAGTSTISYMVTAGCGTATAVATIQVDTTLSAGSISGSATVCSGTTITLTESATGGTWGSSNVTIAAVNAGGIITGIDTGTATISYTVTNSCGAEVATAGKTVLALPYPGIITGITNVCQGASTTLGNATGGGMWSSSTPGVATTGSTGVVHGVATGTAVISYTITNTCGAGSAVTPVAVDPLPDIAAITGFTTIVEATATLLSDAVSGGEWRSGDSAVAIAGPDGIVAGISPGTAVITYTLINGYGCSSTVTTTVTVILPSGVNTLNAGNWYKLYPNPASGDVAIAWQNQAGHSAQVVITDVLGREVYKSAIDLPTTTGKINLNLTGIKDGVYVVTITSAGGYYSGKLVIE